MAHREVIPTGHHDLRAWFAETRHSKPPELWQAAFADLMADWKRQGRLPTRESTARFCAWLGEQQQLALAQPRARAAGETTSSAPTRRPSTTAESEELIQSALQMALTGLGQADLEARSQQVAADESTRGHSDPPRPPQSAWSEYLDLLNEIRQAAADFERNPDKAIELLREVVDALPTAIRSLVSRETLSDETLDEVRGLLSDALDFLEALPPEAFSAGLDSLQLVLDVVGLIPGVGEPVDAVNLVISAARQDFLDVGLGIISLIPILGMASGGAKIVKRFRRLKRAISVLSGPLRRLFSGLADAVSRIGRETRPSNIRDAIRKLREELKRVTEGVRDASKRQADEAAGGAGRRADEGAEAAAEGAEEAAEETAEAAARRARARSAARHRRELRKNLKDPPDHLQKPEAHHDLPIDFDDKFDAVGLDIDDAAHGRWVEGTPPGDHQRWSAAFNEEWRRFFDRNDGTSRDQILDFMETLRRDPRFQ